MDNIWSERYILVTGASRGIGRAIAIHFANLGANVIGTATTTSGAEQIELYDTQKKIKGIILDLTNHESIDRCLSTLKSQNIQIDTLINNAGKTSDRLAIQISEESWTDIINANVSGPFFLTQALIRSMIRARFGRVINITSVVGHTGNAGQASYSASKSAMTGLMKSIALEVASRSITVNMIAPGFIETDMTAGLSDGIKEKMLESIPQKRFGSPEDIAFACEMLADRRASYITGQTIHVNGGLFVGS
ncbi:MAG: SDR family oxidoreductase [Gammaproteobacteria bacterium]|nr:SDR family oxidoreductase [Gammaproteobacteria bacterium]